MQDRVAAIIVTYNRAQLLRECLDALSKQDRAANAVFVVDNCSTDDTSEVLQHEFSWTTVLRLDRNEGCAGGMYRGIQAAYSQGFDLFWLMDDDTIPEANALSELMTATKIVKDGAFFCSQVYGPGGYAMNNWPAIDDRPAENGFAQWNAFLAHGLVALRQATFVSLLVPRSGIASYGLPLRDFFIWWDDTEFTQRLSVARSGYLVGKSRVLHKTTAALLDLNTEKSSVRMRLYFYYFRNMTYQMRRTLGYARFARFLLATLCRGTCGALLTQGAANRISILWRGVLAGLFFHPILEYPVDESRVASQPTQPTTDPSLAENKT